MCFDVTAVPGDHLELLSDRVNDLDVRAQVASALNHPSGNGPVPLIIDQLVLTFGREILVVSTERISSQDRVFSIPWTNERIRTADGAFLTVFNGTRLTIQPRANISLVVTRHGGREREDKADYLGFSGEGFSDSVDGLIGSFFGKDIRLTKDSQDVRGHIRIGGEKREKVTLAMVRDIREDTAKPCWYSGSKSA